jgi:hypothetical protein
MLWLSHGEKVEIDEMINNIRIVLDHHSLLESAKTGWFEIRILCPSEAACLPVDYSVSEQRVMV